MEDQIRSAIKNNAQDLTVSLQRDVPQKLRTRFSDEQLFEIISDYMDDPTITRREWIICIETLCQIDPPKANHRLAEALKVDDDDKRFRVVKILGKYGTSDVVPALIHLLKVDPDPSIRCGVAYTLGLIGDKSALKELAHSAENDHALNYEDVPVSSAAQEALSMLRST